MNNLSKLDPIGPDVMSDIAEAKNAAGLYDEALWYLDKALDLDPDHIAANNNLGKTYWGLGKIKDAASAFRRTIAINPNVPIAHTNLGLILLLQGKYEEGWREHDWRWLVKGVAPRPFHYPLWRGEKLDGELLIWSEQGLGDEILYASMIGDLVAAGHRVVWECEPRLVSLIQRSYPSIRVVAREFPPQNMGDDIKAHLPAGTLGYFLRRRESEFPIQRRQYLKADESRVVEIWGKFPVPCSRMVGVSWFSTNPVYKAHKSTRLEDWRDILTNPACDFVGLQYGDDHQKNGLLYAEDADLTNDIEGLAALISLCGLVITVSNTVAHLAGALGVETWVLVPSGERLWYWGTDDKGLTPWYPSARLFRQKRGETWAPVMESVAKSLVDMMAP